MGLFIKTRRYQKECVACMRLHNTIDKHKMLACIVPIRYKKSVWGVGPEVDTQKRLNLGFDILDAWD